MCVAEHRAIRCTARNEWTEFLSLVRCRTSCARRETCRRRASVFSSGIQTSGRKWLAYSCASTAASILSVLTRASAMSRTCSGFAIATRATCGRSTLTMAAMLPVASSTT
ncbi:hypothetical protein G6F65_023190 [Rhizopus arrhizus]|nr:hypothetical protein G6F65_023190 [Rhizopus arrhizus]